MSKSIFKEALADAAAIKQAALATAKLAIEEQFSPALEAMINKKLAEDMEEGDGYSEEGHEKGKVPHDARSEKEKPLAEKKKSSEEKKSSEASEEKKSEEGEMGENSDIEALLRELDAQEDPSYTNYSDNEHMEEGSYSSEEDKKTKPMDEKKKASSEEKKKSSESEAEVEEAKKKSKSSEADAAPSEHDADEYEKFLELKHKFEPKGAAGKKSSEAEVKIDETDEEINKLIAELEKENSGDSEHDESSEMDETDGYTEKPGHKDKQPYMKKEAAYSSEEDSKSKPMDEDESAQIRAELAEVRKQLSEANLINAKAIFFSKIVKENDNLKKDDKVKILKQLDKATSSREAKLIYETITESLKVSSNKQKATLKESIGFASAAAGNAPEKRNPDNIIDEQFSRWQKLAGLNRK